MRNDQNERGEKSHKAPAGREDTIKDKMEPERTTFESSSAGTGAEAPKQPRLSCREIQPTPAVRTPTVAAPNRRTAPLCKPLSVKHPARYQNSMPLSKRSSRSWAGYTERWKWTGDSTNSLIPGDDR